MIEADTKILVGKSLTQGLDAGGDPKMGSVPPRWPRGRSKRFSATPTSSSSPPGWAAAPALVRRQLSRRSPKIGGAIVGMVSTPFNVERARTVKAEEGLESLRNEADSIIVLDNNRLLDYVPNLPIGKAFSVMDQIIAETVKGISETITQPSLINLDYADMSTIMNQGGVAVMLVVGETQDKNKTQEVVSDAMNHPLLDVDYRGASGGLVHITGGPDLTLKEAEGIANNITERLEASANVIWGARIQDEYKGKVRVMAIMTGVQSAQVLGPSTQKQADKSRAAVDSDDLGDSRSRAAETNGTAGNAAVSGGTEQGAWGVGRRQRADREEQRARRHSVSVRSDRSPTRFCFRFRFVPARPLICPPAGFDAPPGRREDLTSHGPLDATCHVTNRSEACGVARASPAAGPSSRSDDRHRALLYGPGDRRGAGDGGRPAGRRRTPRRHPRVGDKRRDGTARVSRPDAGRPPGRRDP